MKKIGLVLFILVLLFIVFKDTNKEEEFRIRVIANSNSYYDQKIKYQVVDILKEEITPNDSIEKIKKKLPLIDNRISKIVKNYQIVIKRVRFPPKQLNGKVVPGGYYNSLVIELGNATGKNWWSLLYPEYFTVSFEDIETGDVEFRFFIFDKILNK